MTKSRSKTSGIIIDSYISLEEALEIGQITPAPENILREQRLIELEYYSFDNKVHRGQMILNERLVGDVRGLFVLMFEIEFPVGPVKPGAYETLKEQDLKFDEGKNPLLGGFNISSGFCHRNIAKTDRLSNHAKGEAIDINPFLNPYIRFDLHEPPGSFYNPEQIGTLTADHPVGSYLKERGWEWGGEWKDKKDYMHFEKPKTSS